MIVDEFVYRRLTASFLFLCFCVISSSGQLSDDTQAGEQIDQVLRTYGSDVGPNRGSYSYKTGDSLSPDFSSEQYDADFPSRSRRFRSSLSSGDSFLDLDPVDSLDIGLPSISKSDTNVGPHIRIHLASKGERGREKDEEKIAALLEASKLAKQSMQTLKVP